MKRRDRMGESIAICVFDKGFVCRKKKLHLKYKKKNNPIENLINYLNIDFTKYGTQIAKSYIPHILLIEM